MQPSASSGYNDYVQAQQRKAFRIMTEEERVKKASYGQHSVATEGTGAASRAQGQTMGFSNILREQTQVITFLYRNWRGEIRERHVIPLEIVFGHDYYHTPDQWLMHAIDMEKGARRTFAFEHMLTAPRKA